MEQSGAADDSGTAETQRKLEELSVRMENVSTEANNWDAHLHDGVQRWKHYQDQLRLLTLWLHRADTHLAETKGDIQQSLDLHTDFFSVADERIIDQLKNAAHELQQVWVSVVLRVCALHYESFFLDLFDKY